LKLPIPDLDLATQLAEFDVWITPSLGEIKDTDKFRQQLDGVVRVLEILDAATQHFADMRHCRPEIISSHFVACIQSLSAAESRMLLESLATVLFLVTAKSDNNAKCQFPLFLRDHARWKAIPVAKLTGGTPQVSEVKIPRELKSEKYLGIIAGLRNFPAQQERLLAEFVAFLLNSEDSVSQLWSVGFSYHALKAFGKERDLLTPLVVFQVRGSVAASGGHAPEELLRARLTEWGLNSGHDFNTSDVALPDLLTITGKKVATSVIREKSRAYDFVLPYKTPGWTPSVFIQSQYYAGDSGSVSHKNVDQTTTSRLAVKKLIPNARFLEYVDGAGYFSSLNGDLKTLLSMQTTKSFLQVRSAAIRLRRELQDIGFVTPLEVEHAILRSRGRDSEVHSQLVRDGYSPATAKEGVVRAIEGGSIVRTSQRRLQAREDRRIIARRYALLDLAANCGAQPLSPDDQLKGALLIPGYGPFHGLKLDILAKEAVKQFPALKDDWSLPEVILGDIRWLCEQGLAMSS
jgi:hypothetical protein